MALKEQANKKKSPRNKNEFLRDGKPLEQAIVGTENIVVDKENLMIDKDEE
ncbi:hypothetical protein [Vulcanibacillus modesticaldus]|uniref:hypothetical protein n=1 Tax=Vulcanibacillus modesticaldus TaxID=337097 RepID=UPI00159F06F1|nr:hypothetical protein [Vulcanibacillus modesticaldus]